MRSHLITSQQPFDYDSMRFRIDLNDNGSVIEKEARADEEEEKKTQHDRRRRSRHTQNQDLFLSRKILYTQHVHINQFIEKI